VAATLSHAGFPVATLTIPQPRLQPTDLRALVDFCVEWQPRWVGMSLMTPDLPRAQALTAALRQARPELPVVWGGIHPTLAPDDALQHAEILFTLRKPFSVNYYPLTFFPGTPLHERAHADGIGHLEPDVITWDKPVAGLPPGAGHDPG
jgi:hypothetical protein